MTCFVISYDLRGGGDYDELHQAIKEYPRWAHILESTWIVETDDSVTQVRDDLKEHMESGDGIFVSPYDRPSTWSSPIVDSDDLKEFVESC